MKQDIKNHIVSQNIDLREAYSKIEAIPGANHRRVIFVLDQSERCIGAVTDGDLRRAIIGGKNLDSPITEVMYKNFRYVNSKDELIEKLPKFKESYIFFVPILDQEGRISDIYDLKELRSVLPLDAFILAGGKGMRLRPLTENLPKPMLKVGSKPIMEHNIDRMSKYGIGNIHISVNYLGEKIQNYFDDGSQKGLNIKYVKEDKPLGTIGSIQLADNFEHDYILVMNSDLLTDIDLEDFYLDAVRKKADMSIATVPYNVTIPYAVLNLEDDRVKSLSEKPSYTYYSNAGIYIIKKENLSIIPQGKKFDATDLIEHLIQNDKKVCSYAIRTYWLDIGKMNDFEKAQRDISHLKL